MLDFLIYSMLIGAGATATLDLWNLLLNRSLGMPLPPWHLVGRWFAGLGRGRFRHPQGIAESPIVRGELAIGWVGHYLVGALFAAIVIGIWGVEWAAAPTFLPALIVGLVTVGAGWFILQPGMGVSVACSGAPRPWLARMLNVVGHVVFAIGLYTTALVVG